ncbi:hypothetical protein D3C72_2249860 [compost metagenome]
MIFGFQHEIRLIAGAVLQFVLCFVGGIGLHRGNAILRRGLAGVHLAGQNDFAIAGFQVEVVLPILCFFQLIVTDCHGSSPVGSD